jgi:hypothetical protein
MASSGDDFEGSEYEETESTWKLGDMEKLHQNHLMSKVVCKAEYHTMYINDEIKMANILYPSHGWMTCWGFKTSRPLILRSSLFIHLIIHYVCASQFCWAQTT